MRRIFLLPVVVALLALTFAFVSPVLAQRESPNSGDPAPNAVAAGTRFLIRLDDQLDSQRFESRAVASQPARSNQ